MECLRCKAEMFPAKLSAYPGEPYLMNKKPGLLEPEKRSRIGCFVCPACGYVELKAEEPSKLKLE